LFASFGAKVQKKSHICKSEGKKNEKSMENLQISKIIRNFAGDL
jgi:hypothetical protein